MRKTTLATFALLFGVGLIAACTTESTNAAPNTTATDGGTDAGVVSCTGEPTGAGTITLTVSGLPDTVKKDDGIVKFVGKKQTVNGTLNGQLLTGADSYESVATIQFAPDPIVRTAYSGAVTPSSFCLNDKQSQAVAATYAAIPSSNKLWTTNNSPSGQVLGFASSALAATGTPAASVAIKSPAGGAIAFDAEGNMWTLRGAVSDAPIQRYAASTLGASGDKTPDRLLTLDPGCVPGLTQLAFSPTGELYVSSACGKKISRLAATDLGASGSPAPNLTLSGLDAPEGMAFDRDGNLWVADSGSKTIARFDAARLQTPSADPANYVITPKTASAGDLAPNYLAFSPSGDLWASSFGGNVLYRIPKNDQLGTGPKDLTPAVQLTLPVDALIEGIAFDESGALWLTLSQGKIGRVSAVQLGTSSTAGSPTIPEVIVTSADIGNAASLAFYPPPANSPIYGH